MSLERSHFIEPTHGKEACKFGRRDLTPWPLAPPFLSPFGCPFLSPTLCSPLRHAGPSRFATSAHITLPYLLWAEPTSAPNSRSYLGPHLNVYLCWTRGTLLHLPRRTVSSSKAARQPPIPSAVSQGPARGRVLLSEPPLCAQWRHGPQPTGTVSLLGTRHCCKHFLA